MSKLVYNRVAGAGLIPTLKISFTDVFKNQDPIEHQIKLRDLALGTPLSVSQSVCNYITQVIQDKSRPPNPEAFDLCYDALWQINIHESRVGEFEAHKRPLIEAYF